MVYFTCNACGEQIKKPQVEKHYTQKCRNCSVLTCIDCLKDFHGDDYKSHTACMSEEQRYSKEGRAGWDPSVGQGKKGEKRQMAWTANLKKILDETDKIDADVQRIINTILNHDNIPRKKPKFINFIKNIMGHKAGMLNIDKTWELFSQALKPVETKPNESSSNGTSDNSMDQSAAPTAVVPNNAPEEVEMAESEDKVKKKKNKKNKNKIEEQVEVENVEPLKKSKKSKKKKKDQEESSSEKENVQESNTNENGNDMKVAKKRKRDKIDESMDIDGDDIESSVKKTKFDWDEVITEILVAKDGNEMKLVKLKKKCVNEFFSRNEGTHKTKEDIGAKFDKKLKKRKYRILKDRVKLIANEEDEVVKEEGSKEAVQTEEPVVAKPFAAKPSLLPNQV